MPTASVDTIAAIATPPGRGGVAIIRVSGSQSGAIAQSITKQSIIEPRKAHYVSFYDHAGEIIDRGLMLFFRAPHSFTGEDVIELHAHGNPFLLDALLKEILRLGARAAEAGEFSKRAFLNNKIDLAQAEAIADLIEASSIQAVRSAVHSLQGEFSARIHQLVEAVIQLRTYIEAAIDFSEEEIDFLQEAALQHLLNDALTQFASIESSAKQGAILREGMTVVIAGKPNVGKSSLLNALSEKDSAIVASVAGTTRDVLREQIHIDGMPLQIIDTAGLQETQNEIEQEGIRRAWLEIEKADRVLFVVDDPALLQLPLQILWPEFNENVSSKPAVTLICNKIDLLSEQARVETRGEYTMIYLSAKYRQGIDLLKNHLKAAIGFEASAENVFLARRRHLDALAQAKEFLLKARSNLIERQSIELAAEELRYAQQVLSEITGEFTTDDLLGNIFSKFCVGK
ncbi:MAG: tRNA uridine-5-carboxymethylaminomethyl(34) synthesis GTPase MnmE [Gammaproteobacteria bacterium GWE2_42_36]|nr:MAG: tRNA uridine-5-carboxymethylaminomethyl(34) synthesis GTPase MnmE [Gammaproteobacteria bacterium GWE2_42_36]HCU05012.1 tRNA uridine-5-carboxymethylaminomethyl(34) synthesis GTPase MnmE [Coxiellaceae bacterium]